MTYKSIVILNFCLVIFNISCSGVFKNNMSSYVASQPEITSLNCKYSYYYANDSFTCSPIVSHENSENLLWSLATDNTCSWATVSPSTGEISGTAADESACVLSVQVEDKDYSDKSSTSLRRVTVVDMGSPISTSINEWTATALDPTDEKPFIVFSDTTDGGKIKVYKWDSGTTWTSYGTLDVAQGNWATITIDPVDNKPVVAWQTHSNWRINVAKWDSGTTWIDLGEAGSTDTSNDPTIDIAADGNIYAFYRDHNAKQITVFTKDPGLDGILGTGDDTPWATLGVIASTTENSAYYRHPIIKIDPTDGKPIVAYTDTPNGNIIRVKKWDTGTTWTDLGDVSTSSGLNFSMILDPSDNKPIIVYEDKDNGDRAAAAKWSTGTTWESWGYITQGSTEFPSLAVDPRDNSYLVILYDKGDTGKVRLYRRNAQEVWIDEGVLSEGRAIGHPVQWIQVDSNGRIYTVYRDYENSNVPRAMYWEPNL